MDARRDEMAVCEKMIGGHVREFAEWSARELARLSAAEPEPTDPTAVPRRNADPSRVPA